MKFGAHIRTRGGIFSVIDGAKARDAEAAQFFASNPRQWAGPRLTTSVAREFRAAWRDAALGPLFVHALYLVNIASPQPDFHRKSVDLSRASMAATEALGATGLVVHAGAGGPGERSPALERAASALDAVAAEASSAWLIVELMAGSMGAVASTFLEAAELFAAASRRDRLRLCVDTCHLFASGYALDKPDGVRACFREMRSTRLARRLVLVHANDAAFPRGSRRDRHANIGRGHIGRNGFTAILADPAVRRSTVICETPGTEADQRSDIRVLRRLAG